MQELKEKEELNLKILIEINDMKVYYLKIIFIGRIKIKFVN